MLTPHAPQVLRARQRGLSLVEMMVGIAVGLLVVAGASLLVSTQLNENRRLLIETQLQQDMRASMDIITRELRRTGAQSDSVALHGLWGWSSVSPGAEENPYAASLSATVSGVAVNNVTFGYQQPSLTGWAPFGFKLESNSVKSSLSTGNWQELTDPNVLKVTKFEITPQNSPAMPLPCPSLCADGTTNCWPKVQVREFAVTMEAEAKSDPSVKRTISSNVRLRNDYVRFNTGTTEICPAS
jgi:prepilin-type N-terminal cleavage/methylation domain-containing protein